MLNAIRAFSLLFAIRVVAKIQQIRETKSQIKMTKIFIIFRFQFDVKRILSF
jgi:hypothetical protein